MTRSLFVSFVYENKDHHDEVRRWCASGLLGDAAATSETADVRPAGAPAVRAHLKPRIQGASAVLVLVGNDTHNHRWVRDELAWATSAGKLVIAARIPGTTGAAPEGFRHLALLPFEPGAIRRALGW